MFSFIRVPGVTISLHGNKTLTKTPSFMSLIAGLMFLLSKSHIASGFIQTFIMFSVYLLWSERFPGIINGKGSSPDSWGSASAGLVLSTSHCSWRQILLLLRIRNSQTTRNKFNNIPQWYLSSSSLLRGCLAKLPYLKTDCTWKIH